jgi:hypothetical protein
MLSSFWWLLHALVLNLYLDELETFHRTAGVEQEHLCSCLENILVMTVIEVGVDLLSDECFTTRTHIFILPGVCRASASLFLC